MTAHEIVELITVAECSCGEQVVGRSDEEAEDLMAEHVCAARAAEAAPARPASRKRERSRRDVRRVR